MEECIFLSAHLPSPFSKQAGQRAAYNRLSWLSNHYNVILVTFQNEIEEGEDTKIIFTNCCEVHIYPIDRIRRIRNYIENFTDPIHVAVRKDKRVRLCLKDIFACHDIAFVWVEYEQMAAYLPLLNDTSNAIVCHDVLSQMYERKMQGKSLISSFYKLQFHKTINWEKNFLRNSDAIVAVSEKDRKIILNTTRCDTGECFVSFPKVTRYKADVSKCNIEKDGICFFGAMNREENIEAVKWFLDNIWNAIKQKNSCLKFYIIGSSPTKQLKEYVGQYADVIVTGFVDNPANIMQKCFFSVAPLLHGAGIKTKVIECMEQGLPVVTTQVGAEGIDADQHDALFVTDKRDAYIDFCERLLDSDIEKYSLAASQWFINTYEKNEESETDILNIVECIRENRIK